MDTRTHTKGAFAGISAARKATKANAIATPKTISAQQLMDYVCAAGTRKEALGYCEDITDERDRLKAVNADLLAACERMVKGWGSGNEEEAAIDMMRAATAKARA